MSNTILEKIGLTKREAEIYEFLLRLGDCPISDVLKVTGLHPQIVYRVIDSLVAKGLAVISQRNSRKYVRAESPEVLKKIEEDKLSELRAALPHFLQIQQLSKDALVRVARGNEAVYALRKRGIDELKSGETYYIIGASGQKFYEIMGERYAQIEKKRIKKGVRRKLIAFKNQQSWLDKNDPWRKLAQFRYLDHAYAVPSSTNIFKNTVAILIWSYDPIVITIESPAVAESYRQYFSALWKIAKS